MCFVSDCVIYTCNTCRKEKKYDKFYCSGSFSKFELRGNSSCGQVNSMKTLAYWASLKSKEFW